MAWWVLLGAFALLALHPFVTYPLSLLAARALHRVPPPRVRDDTGELTVAVLCCAYNEEAVIAAKLENSLALQAAEPTTRVLFYTDGCSDRTAQIIAGAGDRVRLIASDKRQGKSHGMNLLAAAAGDVDILLFTDANVRVDAGAIAAVRRAFTDPAVGCACGHLVYVNPEESATARAGAQYWSFDEWLKRLETDTGSCVGADGSLFAIRRALFRPVPADIIDDFFTSLSIWCAGWREVMCPDLIAYERSATRSREEFRRKVRIACRAFNCHRLLWPQVARLPAWDLYKYLSHKLLRWVSGCCAALAALCLLAALISAGHSPALVLGSALVLGGALWLGARLQLPPMALVREAVLAVAATAVGVVYSLRGQRFQTWAQPETTRQAGAS
jgi:cellulose synthase/poly-beta-1,6-N-acetylglucosamine synthase-like glycosyltransferase